MEQALPSERKAALLDGLSSIKMAQIPMPEYGDTDVVVRIKSIGICGSDLVYYQKGGSAFSKIKFPHVLGHEASGEVVAIGKAVKNIAVNDRVAIEPGVPCGKCDLCKSGHYNLCKRVSFMSTPIYVPYSEGAFVEYSIRPAEWVYKIPERMSFDEGAMIEPLAVGMQAVEQSTGNVGMSAIILGCGPISLCIMYALHAKGIHKIFMVDVIKPRTLLAKKLGASEVFSALDKEDRAVIIKTVEKDGVDLIFDTTNFMPLVNQAIDLLGKNGHITMLGVPDDDYISLNYRELFMRQASVHTSFRYANQYKKAIDLVSQRIIPIANIITHTFPFSNAKEALDLAVGKEGAVMKVVLSI
ncbi:sorbitol dehydrogenase [Spirochaetia bacterium]|nr:sorbitol dehydrogenase [Spirochaetia bacterium]